MFECKPCVDVSGVRGLFLLCLTTVKMYESYEGQAELYGGLGGLQKISKGIGFVINTNECNGNSVSKELNVVGQGELL